MKFDSLKPGMTVYDVAKTKMGNTTLRTVSYWSVYIKDVDHENKTVLASWNGNPAKTYYYGTATKWRAKPPILVRGSFGQARLATREEIKAMKSKDAA